jgi:CBS domain-containing protein
VILSSLLHRESVYTAKLARRGVRLSEGRDFTVLRGLKVSEIMETEPVTVPAHLPISELVPQLLAGPHTELLVVDEQDNLLGTVSLNDVRSVLPDVDHLGGLAVAADAVVGGIPTVVPDDNLELVMHLFGRTHRDQLPVCSDSEGRRVVGVVTLDSVIDAYNRRVFHLDLTGGFGSLVEAVHGGRSLEVLAGISLTEVGVPAALVGQTLAEADIRRRFGVEVILIHTPDGGRGELEDRPGKLPTPQARLEAGDLLLVMGTPEAIRSLQE